MQERFQSPGLARLLARQWVTRDIPARFPPRRPKPRTIKGDCPKTWTGA